MIVEWEFCPGEIVGLCEQSWLLQQSATPSVRVLTSPSCFVAILADHQPAAGPGRMQSCVGEGFAHCHG